MNIRKFVFKIGVKRLLVTAILLTVSIFYLEERILSDYNLTTEDTKLPFEPNDKGRVHIPRPQVTPVIILAYMRTGSSLTGDILQQNSDVFYVFEPLHDLEKDYHMTMDEMFPELQIRQKSPTHEYKANALQLLKAWFSCDIRYITADKKRFHFNFFKYGNKTRKLVECLERAANETNLNSRICTKILRLGCLKSKIRVFKTIRTRLAWLTDILDEFPTLKIIHLVRDPRAVVNSLIKVGECREQNGGVPGCSHYFCSNLEEDLTAYRFLKMLYRDRIERITFENLAEKPIAVSKQMYDFIDMELDGKAEAYIGNLTSAGNNSTGVMSTIQANSTIPINAWRTSLSEENLSVVQTICKSVMEQLGYHHFIRP